MHRKCKISRTAITLIACVLGLSAAAYAELTKPEHKAEEDRISAEYKSALNNCGARKSSNAKDICMAEARGAEKIARAELEARDKGTPKAQAAVRIARAEAQYAVAGENCDNLSGNAKEVCLKDAQAALARAKADAKADRKSEEANKAASDKVMEARRDASEAKRQADYNAARERCDAFAGDARDRCIAEARAKHGMK